jgi:hypothetical protein
MEQQQQPAPPYLDPAWVKEVKILKLKQEGVLSNALHSKDFSYGITLRSVSTQCNCGEDPKNSTNNAAQTRKPLYE